jgi:tetratricopeptide (TPR) repeat protein
VEEALAFLRAAPDCVTYEAVRFVATLTSDFAAAQRIARLLASPDRPPELHGIAHILAAFLELTTGRRAASRRELTLAAPFHPTGALEYRGLLAGLPFLSPDREELDDLRQALAGWDAAAVPRMRLSNPAYDLHHDAYPVLRLYLLGVLAAREGDAAALDCAAELDTMAGGPDLQSLARDLAQSVRARVLAVAGDAAAALECLGRARMESRCTFIVMQSPFYMYTAERWLRAELLQRLGRHDEAVRWYESLVQSSVYELIYLAPSHLHRARIYDGLGQRLRAASHYRRVVALWKGCDPELRPAFDEAAGWLQRMASGGRMVEA